MKMAWRKKTLKIQAMITPRKIPGIEKLKLCSNIIPMSIFFLNPSALSIPYSYVFPSTSASMSEYKSIVDRIAKNTMTVISDAFKND